MLSPQLLISLLVYMAADGGRRGYQHLLDGSWHDADLNGVQLPVAEPVSAPAFCNARKKLCWSAIHQLLRDAAGDFDNRYGRSHRIHGRRVLAVDATQIPVQRTPEFWKEFGSPSGGNTPQITVSVLFDVVAKVPIDAVIGSYASDERALLVPLLSSTRAGDILVLDRGYPSYAMIDLLLEQKLDFVMRVRTTEGFGAVRLFLRSKQAEADIVLTPWSKKRPRPLAARKLRAVRRKGPSGEAQVFLTT